MQYNEVKSKRDHRTNGQNNQNNASFVVQDVKVYYSDLLALQEVNMEIPERQIIAFIGPSGCGKSTLLRCFNRMNDLIPSCSRKRNIDKLLEKALKSGSHGKSQ